MKFDPEYWRTQALKIAHNVGLRGEDAQDAAQEGVIRAFERWDEALKRNNPGAWTNAVVANKIRDVARIMRRRPEHNGVADGIVEFPDVAGKMDAEAALSGLSGPDAELLRRAINETAKDIAESKGVSVGSVKTKLHRLRKKCNRNGHTASYS